MPITLPPQRSSSPLYRQIESQLRSRIESGEFQPGDRLPSVNELRQHFGGVNHLTVRQALKHLVDDGLVRAEQGRGTFVQQRARRAGRIALVMPHLEDALFLLIARGVQSVFSEAGVKTLILDSRSCHSEESETFVHLEELSLDGAIIFPVVGSTLMEHARRFKSNGFPFVLVDRTVHQYGMAGWCAPQGDIPAVVVDNYGGGHAIGEHLAARGRTRVAWLSEMGSSSAQARLAGLRDGLADAGIALPRVRQCELCVPPAPSGTAFRAALSVLVEQALDGLLLQNPLPDAIACGNDVTALCVLESLGKRGIAVPAQIAVTGFDDVAEAATATPPLTTARQPMERLGQESARLLLELIDGREAPPRAPLPVQLILRAST